MKEIVTAPGNRLALYLGGASLATALCLAGIVYAPKPEQSIKDLEAEVAIRMLAGNTDEAKVWIDELLARDSENLYGNMMQAYIHAVAKEPEAAYLSYLRATTRISAYPELEEDLIQSITLLALKTGRYEEARRRARDQVRRWGENIQSRLIIALSSFCLGDDKSYEENMNRAVEMGIFDPAFKTRLEALLGDMGKIEQIYIQSLLDRARFEQRIAENDWIGRESSTGGSD